MRRKAVRRFSQQAEKNQNFVQWSTELKPMKERVRLSRNIGFKHNECEFISEATTADHWTNMLIKVSETFFAAVVHGSRV